MEKYNYTILQAVYKNDKAEFIDETFCSIYKQTQKPYMIIVIKDGEIPSELDEVIKEWSYKLNIKLVGYSENKGLAYALNYGLQFVETDYIARMDSDDICYETRFEKQLDFFKVTPNAEICGTGINEFFKEDGCLLFERERLYAPVISKKSKCLYKGTPLAHPTMMMKTALLKEFRYTEDTSLNEDIDLWFRLLKTDHVIYNIQEPLLYFRITNGTFKRRSITKSLSEFKIYFINLKEINGVSILLFYPFVRLMTRFLPACLNKKIYFSKMRKKLFKV